MGQYADTSMYQNVRGPRPLSAFMEGFERSFRLADLGRRREVEADERERVAGQREEIQTILERLGQGGGTLGDLATLGQGGEVLPAPQGEFDPPTANQPDYAFEGPYDVAPPEVVRPGGADGRKLKDLMRAGPTSAGEGRGGRKLRDLYRLAGLGPEGRAAAEIVLRQEQADRDGAERARQTELADVKARREAAKGSRECLEKLEDKWIKTHKLTGSSTVADMETNALFAQCKDDLFEDAKILGPEISDDMPESYSRESGDFGTPVMDHFRKIEHEAEQREYVLVTGVGEIAGAFRGSEDDAWEAAGEQGRGTPMARGEFDPATAGGPPERTVFPVPLADYKAGNYRQAPTPGAQPTPSRKSEKRQDPETGNRYEVQTQWNPQTNRYEDLPETRVDIRRLAPEAQEVERMQDGRRVKVRQYWDYEAGKWVDEPDGMVPVEPPGPTTETGRRNADLKYDWISKAEWDREVASADVRKDLMRDELQVFDRYGKATAGFEEALASLETVMAAEPNGPGDMSLIKAFALST